ncbi:MAG: electron transport complex subunit RsxE [Lachnospiraceae bacterium]|nr:electron transport complex subunit RsxE [Lachnospiraceae bacterium]
MNSAKERLLNGLLKENPTFVLMLGMCPTLAVTTSAMNGLGMGLTTTVVLALSNVMISLLRNIIPDKVRIPAFIVVIASFVTIVELLLEGFIPSLYDALGIYIPLIVVNCIILGRAESFASKNPIFPSLFDGLGMGLGFTMALTIIGAVREVLGAGEIFGFRVMPASYIPVSIFVLAPGAFFVLAILTALQNYIKIQGEKKGKDMSKIQSGCNCDCMNCGDKGCNQRAAEAKVETVKKEDKLETAKKAETTECEKSEEKTELVKKAEPVKTEENQKEAEVVDELFFISEVKMKEADIEIVELELEPEDGSEKEAEEADGAEETQEGGTEV